MDVLETVKVPEAARRLNVSRSLLYRLVAQGFVAHVQIAGCIRVPASEVERVAREGVRKCTESVRFRTSDKTKRGKSRANPDT